MSHAAKIAEYQALYDLQFPQDVADKKVVKTNADHIRSMTDEELAKVLACPANFKWWENNCNKYKMCDLCIAEWLQEPYEEDT